MTTFNNYHKETTATFQAISAADMLNILAQYVKSRRSKKITSIEHDGKIWAIDFESERKSQFWRSRSFSFYFICEETGEVMRISDHWSKTNIERSEKLNCGNIRSCWWYVYGDAVYFTLPGERFSSRLMGGICNLADFAKNQYIDELV